MLRLGHCKRRAFATRALFGTRQYHTGGVFFAPKPLVGDAARARRQKGRPAASSAATDKRALRSTASRAPSAQGNLERLTAPKPLTSGGANTNSAGTSTSARASSTSGQQSAQPSQKASAAPMRGRFNRIASTKGLAFASYLYVIGEGMTLGLTVLLHLNLLGIGETGIWLSALGVPADTYLNVGPTVLGLQLSPRLLLNYLVANACCYPLYRFQYAFCNATAPVFASLWRPVRQRIQAHKQKSQTIPKAPSPKSG